MRASETLSELVDTCSEWAESSREMEGGSTKSLPQSNTIYLRGIK